MSGVSLYQVPVQETCAMTVPSVSTIGLLRLTPGLFSKFVQPATGAPSGENGESGAPAGALAGTSVRGAVGAATGGSCDRNRFTSAGLSFNCCHIPQENGSWGCEPDGCA